MKTALCSVTVIALLLAGTALAPGCGERRGSYTYETTLDETLDNYVHPIKRVHLDLTTVPPDSLKGADAIGGSETEFATLILGNYHERVYVAVVDQPAGEEGAVGLLLDQDQDIDLSDEEMHPLHQYSEGSPYFLSDTLVVAYHVDTGGVTNTVERKTYFILKRAEEEEWLRYEFVGRRTGAFDHLGGNPFGFILFDADFNGYYDHRDLLVIDTNRDGTIDGNRNSVERYRMSEPFLLGDRPYRVLGISRMGIRMSIMPYRGEFTPRDRLEVGETAPDFTLQNLSGKDVSLGDYSGKTILLPFWASS